MRYAFGPALSLMLGCCLAVGCGGNPAGPGGAGADGDHAEHADEHADHDHEAEHEGPHGGHVIELGRSHEYHAELVDEEKTSAVTVYILDHDLQPLPIETAGVSINLSTGGESKSFELAAVEATDGKASQFQSADPSLFDALHAEAANGKLRVTIGDASYTGDIEHHDHDEH